MAGQPRCTQPWRLRGRFSGLVTAARAGTGRLLAKTHQLMLERCDELARLVTQENGKPLDEARTEVAFAAGFVHWFAEEARRVYSAIVPPSPHKRLWVLKQPLGVVAAITPWNFPATEDADLHEAIEGAAAIKFMQVAGQSCICANRIEDGMTQVRQGIAACGPPGQRCSSHTFAPCWRRSLPTWAT